MPEYHAVETYQSFSDHPFAELIDRCSRVLDIIGWLNATSREWLAGLEWVDGDGFGWIDTCPTQYLRMQNNEFAVTFSMLGWSSQVVPGIGHDWVEFEILFHTEELDDLSRYPLIRYKPEVGWGIWQIMELLSENFTDFGVFFTDESQSGKAWSGYFEKNINERWDFELGIIQPSAKQGFLPVSATHFSKAANDQLWLARKYSWDTPPWSKENL